MMSAKASIAADGKHGQGAGGLPGVERAYTLGLRGDAEVDGPGGCARGKAWLRWGAKSSPATTHPSADHTERVQARQEPIPDQGWACFDAAALIAPWPISKALRRVYTEFPGIQRDSWPVSCELNSQRLPTSPFIHVGRKATAGCTCGG